ncbi:MAG: glutathione peroxidase [Phycisphaerae bacterium]|nr:glutathione peroxidase [Phycisphaerae bacterium]
MKNIDGKDVSLSAYQGKVILMVNVASKCGLTPQYEGLQKLHESYSDRGLAVLGFPCNQFGGQEPGSEEQIKAFCQSKYGVSFDMFAKIKVNGDEAHPLYKYLTSEKAPIKEHGKIKWNFEKFLVDRSGQVIARFGPRTKPGQLAAAIDKALGPKGKK